MFIVKKHSDHDVFWFYVTVLEITLVRLTGWLVFSSIWLLKTKMSEFNDMIKAFGKELFYNEYYTLWYLDRVESILRFSVSSIWEHYLVFWNSLELYGLVL